MSEQEKSSTIVSPRREVLRVAGGATLSAGAVMLLADEMNIREVIMFPMNQRAEDLLMNAPSEPTNEQLRELRLRVVPKEA